MHRIDARAKGPGATPSPRIFETMLTNGKYLLELHGGAHVPRAVAIFVVEQQDEIGVPGG
jgi:hypothetical protein